MSFQFTCPYCLTKTLVGDDLRGQSGPCVNCGKQITLPRADAAAHDAVEASKLDSLRSTGVLSGRKFFSPLLIKLVIFLAISIPGLFIGSWLLTPAIMNLKTRRDIVVCQSNLQRIAKALNAYAAQYGRYPPPYTVDAKGKPLHSWRVLILPFLNERRIYGMVQLDEPWDSPRNSAVQSMVPRVYVSPGRTGFGMVGESNYVLVTGPGTLFPSNKSIPIDQIKDGLENTLLVVETAVSLHPWTEPYDLDVTTLPNQIGAPKGIGGTHASGATAVFADGKPAWLPSDVSRTVVDGLLSPAGGEAVQGKWFQQ